jgi:F-type H+-transporting ATPase subunit gamma
MASGKVIKNRIKSIKNTKKVTKSMELISAVKLQKASERSSSINQFKNKIEDVFDDITIPEGYSHPYLEKNDSEIELIIVFGSDRGLCGSFNTNIKKKLAEMLKDRDTSTVEFIVYGRNIAKFLTSKGFTVKELYKIPTDRFTVSYIMDAAKTHISRFKEGEIGKISLVYTQFINIIKQVVVARPLLPASPKVLGDEEERDDYDNEDVLEPDADRMIGYILEENIKLQWYSSLVNSLASEHTARMIAMKNATEASGELIDELTLAFNKSRQAAITQEITEIVSGMESVTGTASVKETKTQTYKLLFNN